MKWFLVPALVWPLLAQDPFAIVAVERQGPPPYEAGGRIYRLDGGLERGLKVGERLTVRRPGKTSALGHLQVTAVRAEQAESVFAPAGEDWPMKGDLVWRDELAALPVWVRLNPEALPGLPVPKPGATPPPREGLLWFLPQRADLSPAGQKKLELWLERWGQSGRWAIQVPLAKGSKAGLQKQRGEVLQAALRVLGIAHAELLMVERTQEGPYDPAWVLHWD